MVTQAMDTELKRDFMRTLFRLKKLQRIFPQERTINPGEFMLLKGLAGDSCDTPRVDFVPALQDELHISKAAISQKISALEDKGYVERSINKDDRRRIKLTLTPAGKQVIEQMQLQGDRFLQQIFDRFGRDKTRQLIDLLNELVDCVDLDRSGQERGCHS